MLDDDRVSRDAVFSSIVTEAAGFYKIVTVTASSFLGGSLLFMEKIAPKPATWTLWVLGTGWTALVASIALVAWVRWRNLESGRLFLEGQYPKAAQVDAGKRRCSIVSVGLLVAGMVAVMAFGMANVTSGGGKKENPMTDEQAGQAAQPAAPLGKIDGSIPFGSLVKPANTVSPQPATTAPATLPSAQPTAQPTGNSGNGQ